MENNNEKNLSEQKDSDCEGTERLAVLSFEQVRKLHDVMDENVAIHGRGNFPTLEVTLKELVISVRRKLEADVSAGGAGVKVKDIRLNGGVVGHVLDPEHQPYNDLDVIFEIGISSELHFDHIKYAVQNTLLGLLPEGVWKRRLMMYTLEEAYVGKMVKINNKEDGDCWSLISLGISSGHRNVELKFVDTMRRQFEFTVDSFQVELESMLLFYDCALPISKDFYPIVLCESVSGDFKQALSHLKEKLISTRQPEEIRGGGLLKYCILLARNYKPLDPSSIRSLERYMCSRFFIDFPDIEAQTVKLEAYLRNHFRGADEGPMQIKYLMHLGEVVKRSTVCLMGREHGQILHLIKKLALQLRNGEWQKREQPRHQLFEQVVEQQQQNEVFEQQQQYQVFEQQPQFQVFEQQSQYQVLDQQQQYQMFEQQPQCQMFDQQQQYQVLEQQPQYQVFEQQSQYQMIEQPQHYQAFEQQSQYQMIEQPQQYQVFEQQSQYQMIEQPQQYEVIEQQSQYQLFEQQPQNQVLEQQSQYQVFEQLPQYQMVEQQQQFQELEQQLQCQVFEQQPQYQAVEQPQQCQLFEQLPQYQAVEQPQQYQEFEQQQQYQAYEQQSQYQVFQQQPQYAVVEQQQQQYQVLEQQSQYQVFEQQQQYQMFEQQHVMAAYQQPQMLYCHLGPLWAAQTAILCAPQAMQLQVAPQALIYNGVCWMHTGSM